MTDWRRRLDIKDSWQKAIEESSNENYKNLCLDIVNKLKSIKEFDETDIIDNKTHLIESVNDSLEEFIELFTGMSNFSDDFDVEEFNYVMDDLYDWADQKLADKWPYKKVCWIRTF